MRPFHLALLVPILCLACGGSTPPATGGGGSQPPVARVGPNLAVDSGSRVALDGSGSSDPAGMPVSYRWTQSAGPAVALSDAASARPTFTAPTVAAGQPAASLSFSLVVTSQNGTSDPAAETVTVNPPAPAAVLPPVANAGADRTVDSGATVALDGSASTDPAGLPLLFQWVQVAGSAVALSGGATAHPSFAAPAVASGQPAAVLAFSLVVTSTGGTSVPATVSITVLPGAGPPPPPPPVLPPLASAGPDQAVASGATVTLDGSGSSDPAASPLSYAWSQSAGPPVTLAGAATVHPSFVAPVLGAGQAPVVLGFSLVVTGAGGASAPATVSVTVSAPPAANPAPIADAGAAQAVASGASVTLDGSRSADPDGQAISFAWSQLSGPTVALSSTVAARPVFTAPAVASGSPPATLVFALVVADASAASAPATVTVTVNPAGASFPPPPGTPAPAPFDPNPPPTGGSGSNRWQMGAAQGLYVVDPALGEPTVQGLVVVTFGSVSSGNFIPPAGTVVTLNGVALLRDPALNGAYFRVDPAGPQPVVGSGGRIVLVATATVNGKLEQRTLVFPCPTDVVVTSSPAMGSVLVPAAPPAAPLHLSTTADLTLNVGIAPMIGIYPRAILYGYEPATRALVASGSPQNIPPGPVSLDVPVAATTAGGYLMDLRWPGTWVVDGESGGFCGLVKRFTYAR